MAEVLTEAATELIAEVASKVEDVNTFIFESEVTSTLSKSITMFHLKIHINLLAALLKHPQDIVLKY